MVIHGGDRTRRYYRCSSNKSRGTCDNQRSVLEGLCRERIVDAIRVKLTRPEALAYVRKRIAELLGDMTRERTAVGRDSRNRLERTEARIRTIVLLMADGQDSPGVREMLSDLEAEADALRLGIVEAERRRQEPIKLPNQDEICHRVFDMHELLAQDPNAGREALRTLLKGGSIRLMPGDDGIYTAKCELLPLGILLTRAPRAGEGVYPRGVSGPRNQCCKPARFEPAYSVLGWIQCEGGRVVSSARTEASHEPRTPSDASDAREAALSERGGTAHRRGSSRCSTHPHAFWSCPCRTLPRGDEHLHRYRQCRRTA